MDKIVNFPKTAENLAGSLVRKPDGTLARIPAITIPPQKVKKPEEKEVVSNNRTLRQLVCCLPFLFAIFCIVMSSILIHRQINKSEEIRSPRAVLYQVKSNLEKKPIVDLQQMMKEGDCPENYEEFPFGEWPGNKSGCKCSDGSVHTKAYCYLVPRTSVTCDTIDETEEEDVDYMRGKSTDKQLYKLCVKYVDEENFVYGTDKGCPSGFTPCDKLKQSCGKTTAECPLSKIETNAKPALPAKKTDKIEKAFQIYGKGFKVSQGGSSSELLPLIAFDLQEKMPCWEDNKQQQFTSGQKFSLLNVDPAGCSKEYKQFSSTDKVYDQFELTQANMQQVYTDNGIWSEVGELKGMKDVIKSNMNFKFFAEHRMKINLAEKECSGDHTKHVGMLRHETKNYTCWLHVLAIIILVFACLIVLIGLALYFMRKKINKNPVKLMYIFMLVIVLLLILGFIVHLWYMKGDDSITQITDEYQTMRTKNCFDYAPVNKSFEKLEGWGDHIKEYFGNFFLYFFWFGLGIAAIAAVLLFLKKKKAKDEPLFQRPWPNNTQQIKTVDQKIFA